MIVTKEYVNNNKTKNGAWSRKQLVAIGVGWPPYKGWKQRVVGSVITDDKAAIFEGRAKKENEILNSVSVDDGKDWSWKPKSSDIPTIKVKASKKNKNRGKNKQARQRVTKSDNQLFYASDEWRELRIRALEKYECKCMMCGRSPRDHGIVIHVDHIKPRSKYPHLSLVIENLQLLCAACNLGKKNKYETDWRPPTTLQEDAELEILSDIPQCF
jgi:5-methylcytosine-specific restriction endonuclease McrA